MGLGLVVFLPLIPIASFVGHYFRPADEFMPAIQYSGGWPSSAFDLTESRMLVQSIFGYLWSIVICALGTGMLGHAYEALNGVDPDEVRTLDAGSRLGGQ